MGLTKQIGNVSKTVLTNTVLELTDDILSFIDTVNQIFRKYKDLIAAKGGPGSSSTPEPAPDPEPEPEPDPTPDPSDRPEIE